MLSKLKEWFALDKSIQEKTALLTLLESNKNNLESYLSQEKSKIELQLVAENEQVLSEAKLEAERIVQDATNQSEQLRQQHQELETQIGQSQSQLDQLLIQVKKADRFVKTHSTELKGIRQLMDRFPEAIQIQVIESELQSLERATEDGAFLAPIVQIHLHHKDSKTLRSQMNVIKRDMKKLLEKYKDRYTTKANLTIYELMVIGLQAELQNILSTLRYANLDKAQENARQLIEKYMQISLRGNALILPTITRFLTELQPLFMDAIKVEYQYYFQKEKEKEEQRHARELIKQENAERKILEEERKKLEKEEEKFLLEISKAQEMAAIEKDEAKLMALQHKIEELQAKVEKLEEQKEEITKRAHGRAGYVYVISNMGSFGERIFKVGMTRRLDPLERIDELGDASVPFKFDVHALIFSENAVELEQKLHQKLEKNRLNKINLRKEFFSTSIEELQMIVEGIDPTIEFVSNMQAVDFRNSAFADTEGEQDVLSQLMNGSDTDDEEDEDEE
jgi:hypothetical protein